MKKVKRQSMKRIIAISLYAVILCVSFVHAEDNSKILPRSSGIAAEQKISQPIEIDDLKNIDIIRQNIDLEKNSNDVNQYQMQSASEDDSENISHSGISLRSAKAVMRRSSKKRATANWVKGEVLASNPLLPIISVSQSKELQELQRHQEDRENSFKKSLEIRPSRESLLLKQRMTGEKVSEKSNE